MWSVRRRFTAGLSALALTVPLAAAATGTAAPLPAAVRDPQQVVAEQALQASPDLRAMATARTTGKAQELVSMRTETGQVFANPDGSKTMEQHAAPVRVRKGTGWVDPDPTLRLQPDGTVQPVATVSPVVLSGGGSGDLLAIGTAGARVHLGWPGKLPKPVLVGDTATYPEVFPGIDLQIKVGVDRFSHLLVVKNRTAAANPALRTLRYPIRGEGIGLKVAADGSTRATAENGKVLYTADPPTMWDSSSATKPRHAQLGIRKTARELILTPDLKLLADPAARFPVLIDPSMSGTLVNWLHTNSGSSTPDGWTYDRDNEGAKVGRAFEDTDNLYRSMFLLNTTSGAMTIGGSTIISAQFRITLNKTPHGTPEPVELWAVKDLDTSNRNLNWRTTVTENNYWTNWLDTRNGEAYPWTEDNPMEFGDLNAKSNLSNVIQSAADARRTTVSLGLKAPDESKSVGAQWQWKKFLPNTAVLAIRYNTTPRMPKGLTLSRPRPCGTQAAPTRIATATPQWAAVANDPDIGDSVTTTLHIEKTDGTSPFDTKIQGVASGAAFSWPETPAGKLTPGVVYRYRAFATDAFATSPSTPDCYFVIDTVPPNIPRVVSTDFPDGQDPVTPARVAGNVTFKPGGTPADTDVTEYNYGFQGDSLSARVKAGADGTVTIPVTVHPDPETGAPSLRLYVRAVDSAGNYSDTRQAWELKAKPPAGSAPHVRGDSNGDGKADVTAVLDHGFGRTVFWNVTSKDNTFATGTMALDTGEGAGFALSKIRPVQGDLDGDGRTDMAAFREGAGRQLWLYQYPSDGNEYIAPEASWTSGPNGWPLSTARPVSGDVDGDGKDDIVVQKAGTGDNWQAMVFLAAKKFAAPTAWAQAAAGNSWSQSTPLLADLDGDGKADLLSMRNLSGCRTSVDFYKSTGTSFAAPVTVYDSGAGTYCWDKSHAIVADPDGDGKDDIITLYENSPTDASLFVLKSGGTALTRSEWRRTTGLELSRATLIAGDYDGDQKEDAGILYAADGGARQVYTFRSTGTSFADKTLGWTGAVDAVTGPKFDLENRQYELVNKNSGKCLNASGASTDDGATFIQWNCAALELNARFRLMPIPGTDQYSIRPTHTAVGGGPVKCLDTLNGDTADEIPMIQYKCGGGTGDPFAWQQVTFSYVEGSSYDTVVQLKLAHSGKCIAVQGARLDEGAPAVQQTCGQATNQQWILRPAFNANQLGANGTGRYRTEAATTSERLLDVIDCHKEPMSKIRMWNPVDGSPCQRWKLESLGDDLYKIIDPNSGNALEIEGCSKLPRATVFMFPSNASPCERWRIEPTPGGSYSVIATTSGLSLDVADCSSAAGAEVITWFYHGGTCQRWFFKP
ncbi:RICIN domain-containing protein [Kribbella sp. NBC_01505]|uniref:RICIN domain-containing protein n=1 Tax=Kribbella sp. NBC_01505 TaxID=2903580 RepID=UPI0038679241